MHAHIRRLILACLVVIGLCPAVSDQTTTLELRLEPPLTARLDLPTERIDHLTATAAELHCRITVPPDGPSDLRVSAWLADFEGHWFQQDHPAILGPGVHELQFSFAASAPWLAIGHGGRIDRYLGELATHGGLVCASGGEGASTIGIAYHIQQPPSAAPTDTSLNDLTLDAFDPASGTIQARCGERWTCAFRPDPLPDNPYDPRRFQADLEITAADGSVISMPAFYRQPMSLAVQGDHQAAIPSAAACFNARFRPRQPGRYQLRLRCRWGEQQEQIWPLPDLVASGPAFNDYVIVDRTDPRFFATAAGDFFWAVGPNIRSVNDLRGLKETPLERQTPDLGTASYAAYLDRMQAVGCNAMEVWMSSWNLALEWTAAWPGYHGYGRYNQGNAAKLDELLDLAWERGIRINLVLHNHGQTSTGSDREWQHNPHNAKAGGYLHNAKAWFTHAESLHWQRAKRRYLIGRYADHPAILGWKLWSEINLTAGKEALKPWHAQASEAWHRLDPYQHPVTTHWAGDYHSPDREIVSLPQLDYVCIDAYHQRKKDTRLWLLAELVNASANDPAAGLSAFGKPLLITEFGGAWYAAPPAQLDAEHRSGPWAGLVSGLAGSPMLWWIEWLDQHDLWGAYRGLTRFIAGEDLRHPQARSQRLAADQLDRRLWARAWQTPDRLLGYVLDWRWGLEGGDLPSVPGARLTLPDLPAGAWTIEWWNADQGTIIERQQGRHPGGRFIIGLPTFAGHLAFKLSHQPASGS